MTDTDLLSFYQEFFHFLGCSHWSEEILHEKYNGIRKRNPKIKNESKFKFKAHSIKIEKSSEEKAVYHSSY